MAVRKAAASRPCMLKTVSMIITIHSPKLRKPRPEARGFTLVEMMVGATLSVIILAATLSTFLFLGRSGANLRNYNDMESQARKALELFAEDTRQASSVTWTSATNVVMVINAVNITYDYTGGTFSRTVSSVKTSLLTG